MTVITIKKMSSSPQQKIITMDNLPKFVDGICEMCHTKVKSTRDQTRHAKGHLSLEVPENIPKRFPHACDHPGCGRRFAQKNSLENHVDAKHTGAKRIKCPHEGCDKGFSDPAGCFRHRERAHGWQPKTRRGPREKPYDKPSKRKARSDSYPIPLWGSLSDDEDDEDEYEPDRVPPRHRKSAQSTSSDVSTDSDLSAKSEESASSAPGRLVKEESGTPLSAFQQNAPAFNPRPVPPFPLKAHKSMPDLSSMTLPDYAKMALLTPSPTPISNFASPSISNLASASSMNAPQPMPQNNFWARRRPLQASATWGPQMPSFHAPPMPSHYAPQMLPNYGPPAPLYNGLPQIPRYFGHQQTEQPQPRYTQLPRLPELDQQLVYPQLPNQTSQASQPKEQYPQLPQQPKQEYPQLPQQSQENQQPQINWQYWNSQL
ncbi:uncharacterized protein SCHCODRAFT_01339197 [Schizophyllum commune H4-8]|uniref:C2H2-type domain-containing protein n=1 Tax=Schizophyllum commune (strain H4-8 / FGSC 9210) TaxID=578458 RepID=D8QG67_SCHCM|nr:uncharacterized protein SCHCODRAFT_01339197 [Schizophyllum commune H4-8]KAI5887930.1 hypothetical protein SCHCODRAFT_01339197 [Schizophyllum commune H4-8]